jgi:hypothetical protein
MTQDPFTAASRVEQHRADLMASAEHARISRLAKSARRRRRLRITWHRGSKPSVTPDRPAIVQTAEQD